MIELTNLNPLPELGGDRVLYVPQYLSADDPRFAGTVQAIERELRRGVPVKRLETAGGTVVVATVYDLLMAQYGVARGLAGDYPSDYNDENSPYTPAWSERYTGLDRDVLIRFAREWARTAELTGGACTIIIGVWSSR